MPIPGSPATHGTQDQTSVIVLTAEPRTPVGLTHRLKLLLGPSGWIATAYHDLNLAFAELCLRERAQASRAAWGLQRVDKLALVIVDPLRWPGVNDLVAAVKRYTPNASIWTYRDGNLQAIASPRSQHGSAADHAMTVVDVEDEQEWPAGNSAGAPVSEPREAAGEDAAARPIGARSALRLVQSDEDDEHRASELKPTPGDTVTSGAASAPGSPKNTTVVTREEIDVLLERGASAAAPSPPGGDGQGARGASGGSM